jgi:hypothetical protein
LEDGNLRADILDEFLLSSTTFRHSLFGSLHWQTLGLIRMPATVGVLVLAIIVDEYLNVFFKSGVH